MTQKPKPDNEAKPSTMTKTAAATESSVIDGHPLMEVFREAVRQAAFGKGQRHGGKWIDFMQQQWVGLAKQHGNGFLTGQAAKKLNEAAKQFAEGVTTREQYETELMGALVYTGMALISIKQGIAMP